MLKKEVVKFPHLIKLVIPFILDYDDIQELLTVQYLLDVGLFRSIAVASAAAAVAVSGYVPPHMELPVSWTDVSKATVCYLCILSHTTA